VTFRKALHRQDFPPWVATRGRTRIVGSGLGSDPRHLPHDIVTLVVERELGITDGFFGTVAAGGTFRSMRKRRHAAGKAVIARNRPGLTRAEVAVNTVRMEWLAGRPTSSSAALDAALHAWRAVPGGGTVSFEWPDGDRVRPSPARGATAAPARPGRGRRR
jgi:hypothetical protein